MLPRTSNPAMISRPIIWIVDSRRLDFDRLFMDIRAAQMEIHFLATGRKLLRQWSAGAPDVCIVNVRLSDLSGFDLVDMIRPFPKGVIVCMLADSYAIEDEVRALSLGVHFYLCKPLEAEVFFELCLCPRARREAALHAVASPLVRLPLADEVDDPSNCNLRNAERRLLD